MFVVDGVVGDYLCAKYGDLRETPLTLRVKDSRLVEAHSANRALEDEFWRYTHTDENSDRVGEFAIGTNIGVHDVIGNILQDEKIPGVHIAFGNPYGASHRRGLGFGHAHRCRRPPFRYLGGRPADHEERAVHGERLIPDARQTFNERFTPAGYERLLDLLAERCGGPIAFRVCETPCFLPGDLLNRLAADGFDLIRQLTESSGYRLPRRRLSRRAGVSLTSRSIRCSSRSISVSSAAPRAALNRGWSRSRASHRSMLFNPCWRKPTWMRTGWKTRGLCALAGSTPGRTANCYVMRSLAITILSR